jgi:GTP pyrophosphokinase
LAQQHLLDYLLTRNPGLDPEPLKKAIAFSVYAHRNQFRKSGMPYAEHPIEVSKILADLMLDTDTVIAGLLHDVVEDTEHTLDEIRDQFGTEVAFMVDAVTKIATVQQESRFERTVATYRKLLISMAKDPRIIMIKMADRLHNMRTLQYMPVEKKKRIAEETLELYVPLTHRFGLHKFKWELEDLSFRNMHPDQYKEIVLKLQESRRQREDYLQSVITPLEMRLNLEAISARVTGRPKHIYSIWRKMQSRECRFEEIFDLFAIRVIVEDINECYLALGYVHNLWVPLQARFKDYIASPKPNMYQSIHTTVIGPDGKAVEIQIRTREMDEIAERGFAAHWTYKQETMSPRQLHWIDKMVQMQQEITDSNEFLDFLRVDLKPRDMLVFTPRGQSITLPHGATVLDFAFAVHTDLGYQCIGARVDNQFMAMDRPLPYGVTVHILRSSTQQPSLEWLHFVITHRAQAAIRRWNRSLIQQQTIQLGKEIFERELRVLGVAHDSWPPAEEVALSYGLHQKEEFFEKIGQGDLSIDALNHLLLPWLNEKADPAAKKINEDALLISRNDESLLLHFAPCCSPGSPDDIVSILEKGQGISVHKADCPEIKKHPPEQIIPVEWKETHSTLDARLELQFSKRNSSAILEQIIQSINQHTLNVEEVSYSNEKNHAKASFYITFYHQSQLEPLLESLRRIPHIQEILCS